MASTEMNRQYVNSFMAPTCSIWEAELGHPVELKRIESDSHQVTTEDLSGYVQLSGDMAGCVVLGISKATTKKLVREVLGDVPDIDEVCRSLVSELAEMITVQAAADLSAAGISLSFELPFVIEPVGSDLPSMHNPHLRLTFGSSAGNLHLHLGLPIHMQDDSVTWLWQQWRSR